MSGSKYEVVSGARRSNALLSSVFRIILLLNPRCERSAIFVLVHFVTARIAKGKVARNGDIQLFPNAKSYKWDNGCNHDDGYADTESCSKRIDRRNRQTSDQTQIVVG